MRSKIERPLTDLGFVTRIPIEEIVECLLTNWTSALLSQIVKAVESTVEDALQASYFHWYNGLRSAMINVSKQALGKVV